MSRVTESLKRLNVKNDAGTRGQDDEMVGKKVELTLSLEETVSHDQNYILSVCGTQSEPEFTIGAGLSDHSCVIYSVGESTSRTITLDHNQAPIVGVKFSPTSKNILYIATNDGLITARDLRAKGKVVAEFKDGTEDGKTKPLASFDLSCDERLVAGGTEHTGGDAFILFWDLRQSGSKIGNKNNLLGGYWESHMDDVTCLTFHPTKRNVLASGSTDGLMNIFDLTQSSEDLALTSSLNTESSVDRLGWLTDDSLWCTTHTHLQLWECEGACAYETFARSHLAVSRKDDPDNCYLVKFHTTNVFGQPFLLAGSSTVTRENLRCLSIRENCLETCYEIIGNKQIVRDSWIHEKSGSLVTVGEKGIINVWRQAESPTQRDSDHKLLTKIGNGRDRHHRIKPY
ncbi:WD repeat-containing protein 89-like isoform X1 [Temnothorax curvispinosus]|uniref:WD repeat-containing protein 89 n=1 Tax=Temnothorax curvispinosus TaxID=300111 RepID=A0A6J1QXC8_9HYME|nr:WD repeat-containing protein 89-like isoform X1 [Temnothorax curvispinosus]